MKPTQAAFAKKLAGKSFAIESGIDACVTFQLRNDQKPYNLYSEIPQERILLNRLAEVLKQSFQVRGKHLTQFDCREKQTLEKRCFVS